MKARPATKTTMIRKTILQVDTYIKRVIFLLRPTVRHDILALLYHLSFFICFSFAFAPILFSLSLYIFGHFLFNLFHP